MARAWNGQGAGGRVRAVPLFLVSRDGNGGRARLEGAVSTNGAGSIV